jgi:ABC-type transport system substrate-binding protein
LAITNWTTEGAALQMLVNGFDYTTLDYAWQPVSLDKIPNANSPLVLVNIVQPKEGNEVVDINGYLTSASDVVRLFNLDGKGEWFDGQVWLKQYIVTYRFKPNLMWADGIPVSRDDYKLAYALTCQPETALPQYLSVNHNCDKIETVNFISDNSYTVTWIPGFQNQEYRLPPFGRLPSHLVLSDGRQLSDLKATELADLPELTRTPVGIGPYQVAEWEAGKFIHFTANPYYYGGQPATPNLIVKFVDTSEQAIELLINGEADILAPGAFDISSQTPELLQAQAEGRVRVLSVPMNVYEHIDFNLILP